MIAELKQSFGCTGGLRAELTLGAVGTFVLHAFGLLLNLLLSIVLARVLTPKGYGIYAFALSVHALLAVPVQFGFPTLVLREVARYQHTGAWDFLRGILRWANQSVLLLSLMVGAIAGLALYWMKVRVDETLIVTIAWTLFLLPIVSLNYLREGALKALRRVVIAQLPDRVEPAALILLVAAALQAGDIAPAQAMALRCVAAGLAFLIGTVMLLRSLPPEVRLTQARYEKPVWMRSLFPLALVGGLEVIRGQTDFLMLGLLASKEDVGLYRVAFSLAALVIFTSMVINTVTGAHIARLCAAGDRKRLQRLVMLSTRVALLSGFLLVGALVLVGIPILGSVYGPEYRAAYMPMVILSVGQLVAASMGSVALILNMAGFEQETLRVSSITLVANVLLNGALIPVYGAEGAAMATAVTLVGGNALLCRKVWILTGINSTAIGQAPQIR